MRELWRRTAALLRARPVLWLPVLAAALLHFILSTLLLLLDQRLTRLILLRHTSIPATTTSPLPSPFMLVLLVLLIGTASLCASYLRFPAFFATAQMGVAMEHHPEASVQETLECVRVTRVRTFWLAVQIMAAYVAYTFVIIFPITFYSLRNHLSPFHFGIPLAIVGLLFPLALAYWMTPSAITLLRPMDAPAIELQRLWWARSFAMRCVGASTMISIAFDDILNMYMTSHHPLAFHSPQALILKGLIALLSTLPYVPLAIAFGYLARDPIAGTEEPQAVPPTYNIE
jgi:hypothetical protein